MVLVPYIMVEDKKHPYFSLVYTKLKDPINELMERTYRLLTSSPLSHDYAHHGFIYRGVRYNGLVEQIGRASCRERV